MANSQPEDEHACVRVDPPPIGERTRGRNRSESFAADDDLMLSEIDAAVGNPGQAQGSAPVAPAASSGPKKPADGQLSRRTLKILNSLEPEGPPGGKRRSGRVDDAVLAEALLAEEEAAASSGVIRRASVPTTAKTAPEHDMVIKILLLGDGGECLTAESAAGPRSAFWLAGNVCMLDVTLSHELGLRLTKTTAALHQCR